MVEQVSKAAREAAAEIVRLGNPGVGNGNRVVASGIKGGLHDDYNIVQAFASFERQTIEACAKVAEDADEVGGLVSAGDIADRIRAMGS